MTITTRLTKTTQGAKAVSTLKCEKCNATLTGISSEDYDPEEASSTAVRLIKNEGSNAGWTFPGWLTARCPTHREPKPTPKK
jgi:hypothetical protein